LLSILLREAVFGPYVTELIDDITVSAVDNESVCAIKVAPLNTPMYFICKFGSSLLSLNDPVGYMYDLNVKFSKVYNPSVGKNPIA
jgi:hypothetical protein